jgi:SAM-dependent methyltransferase
MVCGFCRGFCLKRISALACSIFCMSLLYTHEKAIDETLCQISFQYKEKKNFCDLGCGSGRRTALFNDFGRTVLGVDIKDYRLPDHRDFRFIQGDIFATGFPSSSFDMVFSFDVIEHLENRDGFLREQYRILKDDGILVISTPNKYRIFGAIAIMLGKRKFPYRISSVHDDYPEYWHLVEYSSREIVNSITKSGFSIAEHHKVFYGATGGIGLRTLFHVPFFHNHIIVAKKSRGQSKTV